MFGPATPPDGAGPIGEDQAWPTVLNATTDDVLRGLNPVQHMPGLGMIYRAVSGEAIPATMRVIGAGIVGGPMGALGAGLMGIAEFLMTATPDTSRPSVPAGMSATGAESGVEPVTPGTLTGGAYTTLATNGPEWLSNGPTQFAATRGLSAYRQAELDWRYSEMLEKGVA